MRIDCKWVTKNRIEIEKNKKNPKIEKLKEQQKVNDRKIKGVKKEREGESFPNVIPTPYKLLMHAM